MVFALAAIEIMPEPQPNMQTIESGYERLRPNAVNSTDRVRRAPEEQPDRRAAGEGDGQRRRSGADACRGHQEAVARRVDVQGRPVTIGGTDTLKLIANVARARPSRPRRRTIGVRRT